MNRYRILKHPELEPCTSEQAFVKEVVDVINKEIEEVLSGRDPGTRGSPKGLSSISGITGIQVESNGTTIHFVYDKKTWAVAL